jgi:hypothetical protein
MSSPPIEQLDPDAFLDSAPPEYLRSLYLGARWKLIAMIGTAVCGMLTALIAIVLILSVSLGAFYVVVPFVALAGLGMLGFVIVHYVADFRLTTPDPRGIWHEPFEKFRRILRIILWLSIALNIIGLGIAILFFSLSESPGAVADSMLTQFVVQGIGALWGAAYVVVQMFYCRYLGERMRDLWIIKQATLLSWLLPLLALLFCTYIAPLVGLALQIHFYYQLQMRLKLRLSNAPPLPACGERTI